ncbi:MAG: hypothetical protein EXS37_06410 [Opitutus sp.]|nr:hypothetical protein [Opitutus sp.]
MLDRKTSAARVARKAAESCKDATRYETFDYHWPIRWNQFFQRTEGDFGRIFRDAGIPETKTAMKRDGPGVILFFTAQR